MERRQQPPRRGRPPENRAQAAAMEASPASHPTAAAASPRGRRATREWRLTATAVEACSDHEGQSGKPRVTAVSKEAGQASHVRAASAAAADARPTNQATAAAVRSVHKCSRWAEKNELQNYKKQLTSTTKLELRV